MATTKSLRSDLVDVACEPNVEFGSPIQPDEAIVRAQDDADAVPVLPIDPGSTKTTCGLTPGSLKSALERKLVRETSGTGNQDFTYSYSTTPNIELADAGTTLKIKIRHVAPELMQDSSPIRMLFVKDVISTGCDILIAEALVSFRTAKDEHV